MIPTAQKRVYDIADPNTAREVDNLYNLATNASVPPGAEMLWGGDTAPDGWMLCQGQSLRKAEYPGLFAAIGYRYGTTRDGLMFSLPDRRGLVPIGAQFGGGATYKLGSQTSVFDVGTPAAPNLFGVNFMIKVQ